MTHSMMFVATHDLLTSGRELAPGTYPIPDRLDREVARRQLVTLDATIDEATDAQREYATDWRHEDSSFGSCARFNQGRESRVTDTCPVFSSV